MKLLIETFEKTHLAQIPCLNQFTRQTLVSLCTILRACFTSPSLYQPNKNRVWTQMLRKGETIHDPLVACATLLKPCGTSSMSFTRRNVKYFCNVIYSIFCKIRQSEKDNFDLTRVFMMCIEYERSDPCEQFLLGSIISFWCSVL
jgi:hypothetical protein